ncbi:MAG: hypothetical protein OES57_18635, partial [Acidimicrobiia bacterium]|nr:hypothetical protein [Acidimicrobiia bacterium]
MRRNIAAVVVMLLVVASSGFVAAAAEAPPPTPTEHRAIEGLDEDAWPSLIREIVATPGAQVHSGASGSPVITPGSASVVEGDGPPDAVVEVPVTLTSASTEPVTVDWATFDPGGSGLATAGVDYVTDTGTVVFAAGSTSETVEITVTGDELEEPDEWLLVAFSNPSPNATLDTSFYGLGVGLIVDDDTTPVITPGSASAVEGTDASVEVPVTLSEPSLTDVTVEWTTFDWPGLATGGADYVADSGIVTFPAGETVQHVTITINDDVVAEPGGEFGLISFRNPSANAVLDTSFYGLGGFL